MTSTVSFPHDNNDSYPSESRVKRKRSLPEIPVPPSTENTAFAVGCAIKMEGCGSEKQVFTKSPNSLRGRRTVPRRHLVFVVFLAMAAACAASLILLSQQKKKINDLEEKSAQQLDANGPNAPVLAGSMRNLQQSWENKTNILEHTLADCFTRTSTEA